MLCWLIQCSIYGRPYAGMGRPLYSATVVSSFSPHLFSAVADWMCTILHTWHGLSADLECRSEMCCMRLAENAGHKNLPSAHNHTTLSGYIFRHVLTIGKNLLNSNISSICPHNMVNFGPLTAEISWRVWGTPANFNGCLGFVIFAIWSTDFNRGRQVHLAGWPSRWASAQILFRV